LRYMMGLAATDGRLIRPVDEPTTAEIDFDWTSVHLEALTRRTEIRRRKWEIQRREMELIAAKNNLMPRLDANGTYRWLGAGDDLISSTDGGPIFAPGSSAFDVLESGRFQEWQLGVQFSMPIGFRRAMSGVRHQQLLLARERALLEDLELEISHQIADAVRDIDFNYQTTQTRFNGRVASQDEVDAVRTVYESGRVPIDLLLDAQRRRAEAESNYYRSLVDYNRAIMRVHYRKGSLLEYNGVYLAEGPWPGKAHFDAMRRARQRDASTFINYGYSRPNVISRGPVGQVMEFPGDGGSMMNTIPTPEPVMEEAMPIPEPTATPVDPASSEMGNNIESIDLANLPVAENDLSVGFAAMNQAPAENSVTPTGFSASAPVAKPFVEPVTSPPSATELTAVPATPTARTTENSSVANPFRNPHRTDFSRWIDSTTRGMPPTTPVSNSLRPTASADQPNFENSYESQSNQSATQATSNPASGEWAGR
jgi:hypothetical protein